MKPWIWFNQQPVPADSEKWVQARAFRYGDGIFETMRIRSGKILYPEMHYSRFQKGMQVLGLKPCGFKNFDEWLNILNEMIRLNQIKKGGKVRIQLFRTGPGLDLPSTDETGLSVVCDEILHNAYQVRDPLTACIAQSIQIHSTALTRIKSCNRLSYIMAAREAHNKGRDTALILNSLGEVSDSVSANVIALDHAGKFIIPKAEHAALPGVMSTNIENILLNDQAQIHHSGITLTQLKEASQVFICNVISGILPLGHVMFPDGEVVHYKTSLAAKLTGKLS
jgi:branched-subunit amino acid aminotransferase/4-amino-4-deoxychorismate lyase